MAKQNKLTPVSFRLEPRMKFAAEMLARHQRRSLASTVEWALLRAMEGQGIQLGANPKAAITLIELINQTWCEDELVRSLQVACIAPNLATHDESSLKSVILASPALLFGGVKSGNDFDRINLEAVSLVRELVIERATKLAESGVLQPISDAEWAAAFAVVRGRVDCLEEPEVLGLKLSDREAQIFELRCSIAHMQRHINELEERMRVEKDY